MTDIDLREAVNAAAEYQFGIDAALLGIDAERLGQAWDDAKPAVKHAYRESVRGVVAAAAPVIEAAVRAQITAAYGTERIEGHWLVEDFNQCTCAGVDQHGHEAHERGCGVAPLCDLRGLPGWDTLVAEVRIAS